MNKKEILNLLTEIKLGNKELLQEKFEFIKNIPTIKYQEYKVLYWKDEHTLDEMIKMMRYEINMLISNEIVRRQQEQLKRMREPKYLTSEQIIKRYYRIAKEIVENKEKKKFIIPKKYKEKASEVFKYFANSELKKGLMLIGGYGSGKTTLLKIHKKMNWYKNKFKIFSAIDIVAEYDEKGMEVLKKYVYDEDIFIDDIGKEDMGKFYGKDFNTIQYIIEKRYDLWIDNGTKTHFTTNLLPDELQKQYGDRAYERIIEMTTPIILGVGANYVNFRKLNNNKK